jgi:hypothetical protein
MNGPIIRSLGSPTYPVTAVGAHNFERVYSRHCGSGDVRFSYKDLEFTGVGGGEVLRVRGIANGLLCATGATINAIHATGRVASGATVSGALNAIRATLEIAGTTPTPGGTLSALQLDVNASTGTVWGPADAMIRVSNSGSTEMPVFINFEVASGAHTDAATHMVVETAALAASDLTRVVRCRCDGADLWLVGTTHVPD